VNAAQAPARSAASAFLGRAFRPFFLGVGVYAALFVALWPAVWLGALPPPAWLAPHWWHAHEMLFGVVAAAVAGFLLTAVPVWTGTRALAGAPLGALAALWAAGRVAMLAAGWLPAWLVALVDGAFLPAVALVLARALWRTPRRANQAIGGVVALLAAANLAVHAHALGVFPGAAPRALRFAVDLATLLVVVIGGRITPGFTANALRLRGIAAPVVARPSLDRIAVAATAALAALDLVAARGAATGLAACVAGLAVAGRMLGWQTRHALADPLLWSLHAGLAWVAAGLLLVGAGDLTGALPPAAGLHSLTAGAFGSMILAVMTRVALGHTGRPLVLPRGAALCYALVHAGALARVASAFAAPPAYAPLLVAAAALWAAAFALYAALYAPILLAPRVDGLPG
jgi:uncharacterized protein involved in response to NO